MAFLTTLGLEEGILGAVDINPHKQGTFLAGTGLPIISPSELKDSSPDSVIVMNPIYDEEIRADLQFLGAFGEHRCLEKCVLTILEK